MKVLHLSDSGLPDWRIEKAALTGLKNNYQIFFAGREHSANSIFTKTYSIEWNSKSKRGIPFYLHSVKKQLSKILFDVRPDIIHAHDIFSSKIASLFETPSVYDDHEYWSMLARVKYSGHENHSESNEIRQNFRSRFFNLKELTLNYHLKWMWTKWEEEVVSKHPTIVISETIADDMKRNYPDIRTFVVPNYPLEAETRNCHIPNIHTEFSCVYAGIDKKSNPQANRNFSGVVDSFNSNDIGKLIIIGWDRETNGKVTATGFLSREQMYLEMQRSSVGLLPWKKHWSHKYVNPNKAYEYAHAGLVVVCNSSLETIAKTLNENCIKFADLNDMVTKLKYLKENPAELYERRLKTYEYARNNLIWENHEKNILAAYESAYL